MKKRLRAFGTNLDFSHLTHAERSKYEQSLRRRAYIAEQYRKADEKVQQGISSAGTRFWFQRDGVYSHDPRVDNDINVVLQHTSLPVKERVVHADGQTIEKVLGAAAEEAVRLGYFCIECEERQPEDEIEHRQMLEKARGLGISIESHEIRERKRCAYPYCNAPLGMVDGSDIKVDASKMTDEQKQILKLDNE